jgi:hypothetical protein
MKGHHISRGLAAGFIAAASFAAWFLLVDLVQGYPFRTPAYMSGLIFAFTTALPATARVATFTLIHFLAFGLVGVTVSWLLARWRFEPHLYIGIALGFLLFDLVFYGSVIMLGVNIVRELGLPQLLAGNVLAGLVMLGYLRARSGARVFAVRQSLQRSATLRRGLVAGMIGASTVALWFVVIDVFRESTFYTPAALGSALFFGASQPDDVVVSASVVLGYTLVHFAAFVFAGLFAAWLMEAAAHSPPALLAMVLIFVVLEVLSLGLLSTVANWLSEIVPWWSPIVANLIAALGMVAYLWHEHPVLRERMGSNVEERAAAR